MAQSREGPTATEPVAHMYEIASRRSPKAGYHSSFSRMKPQHSSHHRVLSWLVSFEYDGRTLVAMGGARRVPQWGRPESAQLRRALRAGTDGRYVRYRHASRTARSHWTRVWQHQLVTGDDVS